MGLAADMTTGRATDRGKEEGSQVGRLGGSFRHGRSQPQLQPLSEP